MQNGWKSLALVLAGILLGACVKDLVSTRAHAEPGGRRYVVVDGSMGSDGYEKDLNEKAAEGWRYVGTIPFGSAPSKLVFEK